MSLQTPTPITPSSVRMACDPAAPRKNHGSYMAGVCLRTRPASAPSGPPARTCCRSPRRSPRGSCVPSQDLEIAGRVPQPCDGRPVGGSADPHISSVNTYRTAMSSGSSTSSRLPRLPPGDQRRGPLEASRDTGRGGCLDGCHAKRPHAFCGGSRHASRGTNVKLAHWCSSFRIISANLDGGAGRPRSSSPTATNQPGRSSHRRNASPPSLRSRRKAGSSRTRAWKTCRQTETSTPNSTSDSRRSPSRRAAITVIAASPSLRRPTDHQARIPVSRIRLDDDNRAGRQMCSGSPHECRTAFE